MATIVGVQFQKNGKIYNYDTNGIELKPDDYVVADTPHGADLGQVVIGCRNMEEQEGVQLRKILRIATEKDLQISTENRIKEREAFTICQKKIDEHQLDMKLVSVEYAFDNSKALFYFTANGRVDFRSLVKDLASVFKMRIELRQIGVRDEARMIGGLGPCGRQICCGAFLDEFQPVSIKMAKEQNLSLNPTKISGVCGRLMCCLKYEQDHYEKTRKIMPKIGKEVITPDGTGTVSDLNILKETVFVRITNGDASEIKEYPLDKIEKIVSNGSVQVSEKREEKTLDKTDDNKVSEMNSSKEAESGNMTEPKPIQRENQNRSAKNDSSKKNREAKRSDKLGRPVMRENPNRNTTLTETKSVDSTAKANQKPPAKQENKSQEIAEKKNSSTNWADAVQKAMESIN